MKPTADQMLCLLYALVFGRARGQLFRARKNDVWQDEAAVKFFTALFVERFCGRR